MASLAPCIWSKCVSQHHRTAEDKEKPWALMVMFIKHHDPAALQGVWDAKCFFCVRSLVLSFMCMHAFHHLIALHSRWHQCQHDTLIRMLPDWRKLLIWNMQHKLRQLYFNLLTVTIFYFETKIYQDSAVQKTSYRRWNELTVGWSRRVPLVKAKCYISVQHLHPIVRLKKKTTQGAISCHLERYVWTWRAAGKCSVLFNRDLPR